MRQMVFGLLVLSLLCAVGCKKGKSSGGSTSAGMSEDMPADMDMDQDMGDDMDRPSPMKAVALTQGPTGIAECDKLLDLLCKCAATEPTLKVSCEAVKKDAPGWKTKAQNQDPQQIEELRKACIRTLTDIQKNFQCK